MMVAPAVRLRELPLPALRQARLQLQVAGARLRVVRRVAAGRVCSRRKARPPLRVRRPPAPMFWE
jgi:hypothetical protein